VHIQVVDKVSNKISKVIKSYCNSLKKQQIKGVVEFIPAYNTIQRTMF